MARIPKVTTIAGRKYTVVPLTATLGLQVLARITRILGPGIEKFDSFASIAAALPSSISAIAERLVGSDLDVVAKSFAEATSVLLPSGAEPQLSAVFDEHFAAEYWAFSEWLLFCLEANYGSFFTAGRAKMEARAAERKARAASTAAAAPADTASSSSSPTA